MDAVVRQPGGTPAGQQGLAVLSFEGSLPQVLHFRQQNLLDRLSSIMKHDRYLWVDLPWAPEKGHRTAYIKRNDAGFMVHVGSPRELSDVRWTAIGGRYFVQEQGEEGATEGNGPELESLLSEIEAVLQPSRSPHVVMVFTTGMHHVRVTPWIPNAGGIEVFLREMSNELCDLGLRVSIATRGGMLHPKTGEPLPDREVLASGIEIVYLEDGVASVIRKEDLDEQHYQPLILRLVERLRGEDVSLICSHYFDGLRIGNGFAHERASEGRAAPHVHLVHSLGAMKNERITPAEAQALRMEQRLQLERENLPKADAVVVTSASLGKGVRDHHGIKVAAFMPACINPANWFRRAPSELNPIWSLVSHSCALRPEDVQECKLIVEMGRTVPSKRKEDLILAFGRVHREDPQTLLVLSIDPRFDAETARNLHALIDQLDHDARRHVAVLKSPLEPDMLARLLSAASLYVSPSITEGWGMLVEEAASCGCPSLTTPEIPFLVDYLLGEYQDGTPTDLLEMGVKIGRAGATFPNRDVGAAAEAMLYLLTRPELLRRMGEEAMQTTARSFYWRDRTIAFLGELRAYLGDKWPDAPRVAGPH